MHFTKLVGLLSLVLPVVSCSSDDKTATIYPKGYSCLKSCETVIFPSGKSEGARKVDNKNLYKYCHILYERYFTDNASNPVVGDRKARDTQNVKRKFAYSSWEMQHACQTSYQKLNALGEEPTDDDVMSACDRICKNSKDPEGLENS